jgi:hypothetical protein
MAEVKKIGEYAIKDETARKNIANLQSSLQSTDTNVTNLTSRVGTLENVNPLTKMEYNSTTETITFS